MNHEVNGWPVATDPFDLFAEVWAAYPINERHHQREGWEALSPLAQTALHELRADPRHVEALLRLAPDHADLSAQNSLDDAQLRGMFECLYVIDLALGRLFDLDRSWGTPPPPKLAGYWSRLKLDGRLNPNASLGSIIPRRGQRQQDKPVHGLQLMPARIANTRIRLRYQLCGWEGRAEALTNHAIVFFPTVRSPDGVVFAPATVGTAPAFTVTGIQHEDVAQAEIERAVPDLEAQEAWCAMFPELVVTDPVRTSIAQGLRALPDDLPAWGGIQMVIAGTWTATSGAGLPFNRCYILGRNGQTLWTQDKINLFTLTVSQQDRWNLGGVFPDRVDRIEAFREGRELVVADLPFGRVTVAICEDLAHVRPYVTACAEAEVEYLFCPVLSGELLNDWSVNFANAFAPYGTRTIVSNSLALGMRESPFRRDWCAGFAVRKSYEPPTAVRGAAGAVSLLLVFP